MSRTETTATVSQPTTKRTTQTPVDPYAGVKDIVNRAEELLPSDLSLDISKWRFLLRCVYQGRNVLLRGPSGTGKTLAAEKAAEALGREFTRFNLGSTQDPRAALIGTPQLNQDGTYFSRSPFVKAITTPGMVILLDELSRAHPEALNILMTVLDERQRYLQLDEDKDESRVFVAEGVCFIATANEGVEYTAASRLDRAILDRLPILELPYLQIEEEQSLMIRKYPSIDVDVVTALCGITQDLRSSYLTGHLTTGVSTRTLHNVCENLLEGFYLEEALRWYLLPLFSADGGANAERKIVAATITKHATVVPKRERIQVNQEGNSLIDDFNQRQKIKK